MPSATEHDILASVGLLRLSVYKLILHDVSFIHSFKEVTCNISLAESERRGINRQRPRGTVIYSVNHTSGIIGNDVMCQKPDRAYANVTVEKCKYAEKAKCPEKDCQYTSNCCLQN